MQVALVQQEYAAGAGHGSVGTVARRDADRQRLLSRARSDAVSPSGAPRRRPVGAEAVARFSRHRRRC
jgi:hypothetical protein